MRVVYHPEAEAELVGAGRFYESKIPGLGIDFLNEINLAVQIIQKDPGKWRAIDRDIRRYLVKRFPYSVIYRVGPEALRILAVKHHKRHPEYWKHRKDTP